ncbi:hypothetical protein BpHYR1_011580, partial [Brachionus plicatilis]
MTKKSSSTSKENPPKKTPNKPETDSEATENEEEKTEKTKITRKTKAKDKDTEMIAILYDIPDEKHPFHNLHRVHSSVPINEITDKIDREDV